MAIGISVLTSAWLENFNEREATGLEAYGDSLRMGECQLICIVTPERYLIEDLQIVT